MSRFKATIELQGKDGFGFKTTGTGDTRIAATTAAVHNMASYDDFTVGDVFKIVSIEEED